jgi:hypothetical protein
MNFERRKRRRRSRGICGRRDAGSVLGGSFWWLWFAQPSIEALKVVWFV